MDYCLITPETKEIEKKEKLMIKEYQLDFSNEKYSLILYKTFSNELLFEISKKNISDMFYYKKILSLEHFKKINKCFVFYDTLDDIIKFLEILFGENKVKLLLENNNLVLVLSVFLPTGKQDEIKILFEKNILDKDAIFQKLIAKISNMETLINTVILNNEKKDLIIQKLEQRIILKPR